MLQDSIDAILIDTEQTFRKRDIQAAYRIEPQAQVAGEIITLLKRNHLQRLSRGECSIFADVTFTNLMVELKRIADVCSNVGVATVVRVRPELADHEHDYYAELHSGGDENFNREYEQAHERYFSRLHREESASGEIVPGTDEASAPESDPPEAE